MSTRNDDGYYPKYRDIAIGSDGSVYLTMSNKNAVGVVSFTEDGSPYASRVIQDANMIEPVGITIMNGTAYVVNAEGPGIGTIFKLLR